MAEEYTLDGILGDVAQYFIDCRVNAAKGSAAERRFTIFIDAVSEARKLLKTQEPTKPIFQKYASCCGKCGEDLGRYYPPNGIETRFCPFCGRAVKWDD